VIAHKRGLGSPSPRACAIAASLCFCTPSRIICFAFAASPQPMIVLGQPLYLSADAQQLIYTGLQLLFAASPARSASATPTDVEACVTQISS
jgi:hypothetical protein